jgi:hypothetical protein
MLSKTCNIDIFFELVITINYDKPNEYFSLSLMPVVTQRGQFFANEVPKLN